MTLRAKLLLPTLTCLVLNACGSTAIVYVALKQASEHMATDQLLNRMLRVGTLNLLLGIFILGLAVILIELSTRPVLTSLKHAMTVVEQLATGDLNVAVSAPSQDEVGRLARALQDLLAYLQEVAAIAQHVSQQELHVTVTPRSDRDMLNQALQQMIVTLQGMVAEKERASTEIEQQNWLKDGLNRLNAQLLGDAALQDICQRAISFVARQLGAGQGIVYIYHADQSVLTVGGAFAMTDQDQPTATVRLGEGIVGQVARERRPIALNNVSRSDKVIATGTVNEPPLSTHTSPLMYHDDLYGVLELASFEEFTALQQNFLQEANQVIATVLSSALQRERVQTLLHQSQQSLKQAEQAAREAQHAQAEASEQSAALQQANTQLEEQQQQILQQSEEFRQINQYLEEQQHQLQTQRAELRQREEALQTTQAEFHQRMQALEAEYQQKMDRQPPAGNSEPTGGQRSQDDAPSDGFTGSHAPRGNATQDALRPLPQSGMSERSDAERRNESITAPLRAEKTPGAIEKPIPASSAHRILLVEDHLPQREALAEFLQQQAPVEITGVSSQEEARLEIDTGRYAAAIIDLGLPDGSGYDLCTYVNAHNRPLPIIIYTARDLSENEVHNLERYAASIIVKTARSAERLVDELTLILSQRPLPSEAAPSASPAAPSAPSAATLDLSGRTILIVDADVKQVFIAASLLEEQGATVLDARTGREAWEHLDAAPDIACVLWDVAMPDGYAMLQTIRKDARFKRLPILALTAKDSTEQRQQSIQAGANDYLTKPVEPAALLRALSAWVTPDK